MHVSKCVNIIHMSDRHDSEHQQTRRSTQSPACRLALAWWRQARPIVLVYSWRGLTTEGWGWNDCSERTGRSVSTYWVCRHHLEGLTCRNTYKVSV